jgi:hypothetical protein
VRKTREEFHHLHIELEKDQFNRLKELLPGKGLISELVRRFFDYYIGAHADLSGSIKNGGMVSVATKKVIEENKERRR